MKTTSKLKMPLKNEDHLKSEDDLKNEDKLKSGDDLRNKYKYKQVKKNTSSH